MAQKRLDVRIKTLYLEREKFENYPIFQRELVWPLSVKRTLIDTILRDMYLHPLLVHERKTDAQEIKYYIIDGQQRLSTIFEFMDGKFATTSVALNRKEEPAFLPPIEPNKYYAQLSPEARNTFDDYMLNLYVLAHIDDPMVGLIFRRVQNQVPLSLAEKLWSYTSKTANLAVELAKHPIWTEWFAGPINRRQNFQGSLYPIFIEIARGYANMTTPRLRDLVGGTKDKEITPKLVQKIHERLDAMMHAFAGTPFTALEDEWNVLWSRRLAWQ